MNVLKALGCCDERPLQVGYVGERLVIDGANGGGVFKNHLDRCSEIVKWPAWKVGVLDDRGQVVVAPPQDDPTCKDGLQVAEFRKQLEAVTRERDETIKAHKAVTDDYGRVIRERD